MLASYPRPFQLSARAFDAELKQAWLLQRTIYER
jgi:hypothetical protein